MNRGIILAPCLSVVATICRGETTGFWVDYHKAQCAEKEPISTPYGTILPFGTEVKLGRWQLQRLASVYDHIRQTLPAGDVRTGIMESLAVNMRQLAPVGLLLLQDLQSSTSAGRRLTAIETLASFPHTEHLTWLSSRIKAESAFVGYHTCVALKEAALRLPVEAAAQIRTAIQDALKSLGHGPDTEGRNRVRQDALSVLPPLS